MIEIVHYMQFSTSKISPCGMGRISRGHSLTESFDEVTCYRCVAIVISRAWNKLPIRVIRIIKQEIVKMTPKI